MMSATDRSTDQERVSDATDRGGFKVMDQDLYPLRQRGEREAEAERGGGKVNWIAAQNSVKRLHYLLFWSSGGNGGEERGWGEEAV